MLSCSIPHGHPNTQAHLRAEQSLEQWFCTLWWQVTKQETVPWGQGKSAGRRQQVDGCTHPRAQQLRCFRDGKQEQSRTRQSPHSRTCHRRAGDTPARRCSCRAFNIGGTEFTKTQMSREEREGGTLQCCTEDRCLPFQALKTNPPFSSFYPIENLTEPPSALQLKLAGLKLIDYNFTQQHV